jgi:1-deoxy-D-xylulose-5-phosphate reductoisomerase
MSPQKQKLTILGSTGSIGLSTLDVVARHPDQFEVFALTAARSIEQMFEQSLRFAPEYVVMTDAASATDLAKRLRRENCKTRVLSGSASLLEVAAHPEVDAVMAAIVGAAGLPSCLAAAEAGKRLLLANKEALVVGGELFMGAVARGGATLLPIDSEHSAVFQSLPDDPKCWSQQVEKIILTASGGPFRTRSIESLRDVTPEQACAHPNWVMGRKISVDSATMMNKALEVIEAKFLFGVRPEQIEVVIHPQSVVHSMVQYVDSSVVAQLGTPDMRGPIAYGLAWPNRIVSGSKALNFAEMAGLTFEAMESNGHEARFPGLRLAWECLNAEHGTTTVLNAANEIAVAAFLERKIRFDQIHHVNVATLEGVHFSAPNTLAALVDLDQVSRKFASIAVDSMSI